jgi:hypothetical protein
MPEKANTNTTTIETEKVGTSTIKISEEEPLKIATTMDEILKIASSTKNYNTPSSTEEKKDELTTNIKSLIASSTTSSTQVNFNLRYQNQFIFQDAFDLPTSTIINYHDAYATSTLITTTSKQTVLTALLEADKLSADFSVSDLAYYASLSSFLLNCLTLNITSTPACYNWQYVVDGNYPQMGMDSYNLTGGENIYIYFGTPWKITATTSTFPLGTTTTLQTWRYNFDDTNNEWTADPNDSIEISIDNPAPTDWWDTTITVNSTISDQNSEANFIFDTTGTFYAKITSPDWSKWSDAIKINVADVEITTNSPSTATTTPNSGGGGGTNNETRNEISNSQIQETVNKIINYLKSQQSADGKIIDGGISEWALMTFVAVNENPAEIKKGEASLLDYIENYNLTDGNELNKCAGYPRHILTLYTAGLPLNNLVQEMKNACYVNNVFGETSINDDLFALIALMATGANKSDQIIIDIFSSIYKDQNATNGSFGVGEYKADITGAMINALKYAQKKGVDIDNSVIEKAKTYLKSQQLADGGWGQKNTSDAIQTSWAVMGINALGEIQTDWTKNGKNPWHILINNEKNGHYEYPINSGIMDWFGTKYAVPALLGLSWPIEPRQEIAVHPNGGGEDTEILPPPTSTLSVTTTCENEEAYSTTTTLSTTTTEQNLSTSTNQNILDTKLLNLNQSNNDSSLPAITKKTPSEMEQQNIANSINMLSAKDEEKEQKISINNNSNQSNINEIIDDLPLDTPTRRTTKKILALSGGSTIMLGLYLGLKFFRKVL